MAKKTNDPKLLLQSYLNLAMYWEEFEEGFKSLEYANLAWDLVVSLSLPSYCWKMSLLF